MASDIFHLILAAGRLFCTEHVRRGCSGKLSQMSRRPRKRRERKTTEEKITENGTKEKE